MYTLCVLLRLTVTSRVRSGLGIEGWATFYLIMRGIVLIDHSVDGHGER